MESKAKRKKRYRNERSLSPERSNGIKRSSKYHEQNLKYKNDRTEEFNKKRKYKDESNKYNDIRQSKEYSSRTCDKSALQKTKPNQRSHFINESTGTYDRRNLQSKEALDMNGRVERIESEYRKNEIPLHDYVLKSPDRSHARDRSPEQKKQLVSLERNGYNNYEIRSHREYNDYSSKNINRWRSKDFSLRQQLVSRDSRKSSSKEAVDNQLNEMLKTEQHHTRFVDRSTSGGIKYVVWCPQYINPDIKGHVRGGKSILHHRCRKCRKVCFHLLGEPGTRRLCLGCSGYKEKYIPDWYYHKRHGCKYCQ